MSTLLTYNANDQVVFPNQSPSSRRKLTVNMAHTDGTTNDASDSDKGFLQSRTISSVAVTTPTGITNNAESNTTLAFTIDISGGTAGIDYEFDVLVTLSTSEIEHVTMIVPVRDPGDN